ncbi:MAG: carboxymuconolactone decarboxylase family protein [Acidimicrobiales bacterium]
MAATPETPRLQPLPPNEWSKAAGAALGPLLPPTGRPKGENRPKGLNALGVLARYPELALAYNTFSGQIMYGSRLTARHRELLVLRVATVRDAEYEWRQHVASAGDNGVDPEEVARVVSGPEAPGWTDLERALLRAADELLGDALIGEETWATLEGALDEHELMEVVFTVGAYDTLAMALRTFAVPLDDDLQTP